MGDHGKHGWPTVQMEWCYRVHQEHQHGIQHSCQQLHTLIDAIAEELHVTDYNPNRNWFYQVLKRHHLEIQGTRKKQVPSQTSKTPVNLTGLMQSVSKDPFEFRAKINREVAKVSKPRFTKASRAEPVRKQDFRIPQLIISRPTIRTNNTGYDSDK
jgi:hypothetical protein